MDELLKEVMARLKDREQSTLDVDYHGDITPPSEENFLQHGRVNLFGTTIELIQWLYTMKNDQPWVQWILQGMSYDVKFYLEVTPMMVNFIPRMMILDWPILYVVNKDSPIMASRHHLITRNEIAAWPDKSILVRYQNQYLTDEATDICRYKKITIKVRTEENCIWQEL